MRERKHLFLGGGKDVFYRNGSGLVYRKRSYSGNACDSDGCERTRKEREVRRKRNADLYNIRRSEELHEEIRLAKVPRNYGRTVLLLGRNICK